MTQRRFFRSLMSLTLAVGLSLGTLPTAHTGELGAACRGEHRDHNQVKHYCEAAKDEDLAAESQQTVGIIQSAVTGVCGAACLISALTWGSGEAWCTGTSIAGAVAGLVVNMDSTRKWTNGIAGLANGGVTLGLDLAGAGADVMQRAGAAVHKGANDVVMSGAKTTEPGAAAPKEAGMKMSCFTAAISAAVATWSFVGKGDSEDARDLNYRNADSLARQIEDISIKKGKSYSLAGVRFDASSQVANVFSANNAVVKPFQEGVIVNPALAGARLSSLCEGAKGFDQKLSCALATEGNNLPPFVRDPEFKKMIEKLSGRSADDLMGLKDPKQITQAIMGKVLNEEGQGRLAGLMDQLKQDLIRESGVMRSALASNGSGAQGSSFQFPTESSFGTPSQVGSGNVQFDSNAKRGIASSLADEENPAISLFTRVSKRYGLSRDKVTAMRYQSAENRMLGGGR